MKYPYLCYLLCGCLFVTLLGCNQEERFEPAPNFIMISVMEREGDVRVPVVNADVELSLHDTYAGYKASRTKAVKRTDIDGRAFFRMDEIKQYITGASQSKLFIWARKRGTYLSNHAIGPKAIYYNDQINSAHHLHLDNSVTAALTSTDRWNLKRMVKNGQPVKNIPTCMEDNFVVFQMDDKSGRLNMSMNEGMNSCSAPSPNWNAVTNRVTNGDHTMILTGKPLYWKGYIDDFEDINKDNQDEFFSLRKLSVQIYHPDSITISASQRYTAQGFPENSGNVVYYLYRQQ